MFIKIRYFLFVLFLIIFNISAKAQNFDIIGKNKKIVLPFKLIRDLIIIQLKINNKGPYNFIMDTGAGIMVITDTSLLHSIYIPSKRILKLSGRGNNGDYDAYITSVINIDIPGLYSNNIVAAILKEDHFGLSNFTGIPIHGLIGYELFNSLAIKVNFDDSTLTFFHPKDIRILKKGEKLHINIENNKPYIISDVYLHDKIQKSKLIIDLGATHSLSLDNISNTTYLPKKNIIANLGIGFNGPINGFIGRINKIQLGKYSIKDIITSFPVYDSIQSKLVEKRDGNIGVGLLKKFIVTFDYPENAIFLKPGNNYNQNSEHDMSGLEYYAYGNNFNRIIISRVEINSPGDKVGIEPGDEIISINFKPVSEMSMEQIDDIFKSQDNRNLLLSIYHDKKVDQVIITLKRRI